MGSDQTCKLKHGGLGALHQQRNCHHADGNELCRHCEEEKARLHTSLVLSGSVGKSQDQSLQIECRTKEVAGEDLAGC